MSGRNQSTALDDDVFDLHAKSGSSSRSSSPRATNSGNVSSNQNSHVHPHTDESAASTADANSQGIAYSAEEVVNEINRLESMLDAAAMELKEKDVSLTTQRQEYDLMSSRYLELIDILDCVDKQHKSTSAEAKQLSPGEFHKLVRSRFMTIGRSINILETELDVARTEKKAHEREMASVARQLEVVQRENRMLIESNQRLMAEKTGFQSTVAELEEEKRTLRSLQHKIELENALAVEQIAFLRQQLLESIAAQQEQQKVLQTLGNIEMLVQHSMNTSLIHSYQHGSRSTKKSHPSPRLHQHSRDTSPSATASSAAILAASVGSPINGSLSSSGSRPFVPRLSNMPNSSFQSSANNSPRTISPVSTARSSRPVTAASSAAPSARGSSPSRMADRVMRSFEKPMLHNSDLVRPLVETLKRSYQLRGIEIPLSELPIKPTDRDCAYSLGKRRVHLNVIGEHLVVRSGGGYQNFVEYLQRTKFT